MSATEAEHRQLLHPSCPCGVTYRRWVRSDEPCPRCGEALWIERHEPAFEAIYQRPDGWYGKQNWNPDLIGPFPSSEMAASIRYGHAPGYLICGVCGIDDLDDVLVLHCQNQHTDGKGIVPLAAHRTARRYMRKGPE